MRTALYAFLLDLLPLTDEVLAGNIVLGDALQRVGLDAYLALELDEDPVPHLRRVEALLRLSADLGLASQDVVAFLQRELARVRSLAPNPAPDRKRSMA